MLHVQVYRIFLLVAYHFKWKEPFFLLILLEWNREFSESLHAYSDCILIFLAYVSYLGLDKYQSSAVL